MIWWVLTTRLVQVGGEVQYPKKERKTVVKSISLHNLTVLCLEDTLGLSASPTLVGGDNYDRVLGSLVIKEISLLESVSPRMHASPQTL